MTDRRNKPARKLETSPDTAQPSPVKPVLGHLGGSQSDDWNSLLGAQALLATWVAKSDPEMKLVQTDALIAALTGIAPRDELEGMIAAQLIAAHNAAMECYRRAVDAQTPDMMRDCLSLATKLSRTWAALLEALNRHRGKGQQKVTVEHVHVHAGGQAVVGTVDVHQGGGGGK